MPPIIGEKSAAERARFDVPPSTRRPSPCSTSVSTSTVAMVTTASCSSGAAVVASSATATDAAGNVSPCSTPIGYERIVVLPLPPAPPPCVVPKLVGKKLPRARRMLRNARCGLGEVSRPGRRIKRLKRLGRARRYVLVVRSTSPRRGARPADRKVDLRLGLKRKRAGAKRRRS